MRKPVSDFLRLLKGNKFTEDTFWLISSQIILMGSGLLANLVIGYQYGAAALGVFNQILGFYLILSTSFSLGINNAIIKKIASSKAENYPKVFSSNFVITSVSTLLFTGVTLIITSFSPSVFSSPDLSKGLFIAALSLPFFNLNKNFMAYCTGVRNQKLFSNIRSIRWILIIGLIALVSGFSDQALLLYWAFLIAELVIFVFFIFHFHSLLSFGFGKSEVSDNMSFGLKSLTSETFSILNDKLDLIIIAYFISGPEVGLYSFFIFFSKSLYIFPGILQQNINPMIGKQWAAQKMGELEKLLKDIRKVNLLVVLVQVVVLLALYKVLTDYYLIEFSGSLGFLALTFIGVIPFALIAWGGSILIMTGKLKENIFRTLLLLVFTIISTLVLSSYFGLLGAVWAVVLNGLFGFLLLFGFVKKETGIRLV